MSDGSLFREDSQLWTTDNLEALRKAFVDASDSPDGSFEVKFHAQLADQTADVQRLAAEVVAVHFLFPKNIGARRKMQLVSDILGMAGDALPKDHEVSRAFESGIGSGGPGIHFRRPFEIEFVIQLRSHGES
jgi:5-methylcytosine-specific restriction enzyme B